MKQDKYVVGTATGKKYKLVPIYDPDQLVVGYYVEEVKSKLRYKVIKEKKCL